MKNILIDAGLTENESKLYLSLVEKGSSIASKLASFTDISRPHVYDSLNKLIDKGLASYVIKNNKKYFKAADPKELLSFLEKNKREIEKKEEKIKNILPKLQKLKVTEQSRPSIEVYEGKKGFKTIFNDIISTKKDFIAIGASGKFEEVLPRFSKIFIKKREQFEIKAKLVAVKQTEPVKTELNEYRWIPKEYSSPSTTVIYENTVAILLWLKTPLAIVMKSKEIVESYTHYFELLWKIGKKG